MVLLIVREGKIPVEELAVHYIILSFAVTDGLTDRQMDALLKV